jgi:hypothetical protein
MLRRQREPDGREVRLSAGHECFDFDVNALRSIRPLVAGVGYSGTEIEHLLVIEDCAVEGRFLAQPLVAIKNADVVPDGGSYDAGDIARSVLVQTGHE